MTMRYTLTQGLDPRSTLVVDTCDRIDDQAIEALKRFMHGYGCANGLLFDENECVVLRDAFTDLSQASIREERRIPTLTLLATLGPSGARSLDVRVGRWLELLSTSWQDAIPKDSDDAQELLYDVASAAGGATIHPWSAAA
jgi:hypothetical protein